MTSATDNARLAQLIQQIKPQSRLRRAWPLKGGVSAQVTALEIEQPDGQITKLIVRQHGSVDRAHNPNIAADEFKLLQILQAAGVAAPRPYFVDPAGAILDSPCIVIEYIEGAPEFAPANVADLIMQMAPQLAQIHALDGIIPELGFLGPIEGRYTQLLANRPATLDAAFDETRIRDTLAAVWPISQHNRVALLHGDFWPGNLLWQAGRLVAVIDWEDAALGDPLADLANTRLEIMWAFGGDAMQEFTRRYQSLAAIDLAQLPYWDLCAALRPIPKIAEWTDDATAQQSMRAGLKSFIDQAFARL
ncbi:MAG: phosphotransferase [Chloroflexi bacterium]|nr:phosphotransferase [Chloroflexota bacterium]